MTWDEIAKMAYSGKELPAHASLLELGYYTALKQLYADYISGAITKEEGATMRKNIDTKLSIELQDAENRRKAYAYYQDAIRVCGILRAEINKSNDLGEVADKALQCVALVTGDATFYDHNAKKLGII